jgi:hypothetical protein
LRIFTHPCSFEGFVRPLEIPLALLEWASDDEIGKQISNSSASYTAQCFVKQVHSGLDFTGSLMIKLIWFCEVLHEQYSLSFVLNLWPLLLDSMGRAQAK